MTKATLKMIKLRIFRWRNYAALSRWAQYNHKGPYKGWQEGEILEKRWLNNKSREIKGFVMQDQVPKIEGSLQKPVASRSK